MTTYPLVEKREAIALALICLLTVVCYGQTLTHEFIWDTNHIFANEELQGLSFANIAWVFTNTIIANWHPLTFMSHQLDFTLFGWQTGGHHATSVLLHCVVSILVYFTTRQLIRSVEPGKGTSVFMVSALTALLFALHPQRVEAVAWVAARKDLLYSLFYLVAILCWLQYAKAGQRAEQKNWGWYVAALTAFAMSLMSKSMAVTLPVVLLLLDYYPLQRFSKEGFQKGAWKRALVDKLPFFLALAVFVPLTLATQSGAMADERLAAWDQFRNAVHNVVFYMNKFAVPVNLSPFYEFPAPAEFFSAAYWVPQFAFSAAVTVLVLFLAWRGQPVWFVCWALYGVMLSPASGIVHVGSAHAADRYTYLPLWPACFLVALAITWFWYSNAGLRRVTLFVVFMMTVTLTGLTFSQASHWQNPLTFWSHVLRIYPDSGIAHRNISVAYQVLGDHERAIGHVTYLALRGWPVGEELARAYQLADKVDEGRALLQQLLASEETDDRQKQVAAEALARLSTGLQE